MAGHAVHRLGGGLDRCVLCQRICAGIFDRHPPLSWPASFTACCKALRPRKRNTPHSRYAITQGGGCHASGRRLTVSVASRRSSFPSQWLPVSVASSPENPHAARL